MAIPAWLRIFSCQPVDKARPVIVNIWGQSNAVGQGIYPGFWTSDPRIDYFVSGVRATFGPEPGTWLHGMDLQMGPAVANAVGSRVLISKGAVNGTDIASWLPASGVNWPVQVSACGISQREGSAQIHCCCLHGESDAGLGTSTAVYLAGMQQVAAGIRALYAQPVRFHVALVNIHEPGTPALIQAAQTQFVAGDGNADLLNFDALTPGTPPFHYDSGQLLNTIGPAFTAAILGSL